MASTLPSADGAFRRRDLLLGTGRGAVGLAFLALTASACGSKPPPDVTDLRVQLALANADSELARAAAPAAPRALVPALTQVVTERAQHAQALADEISRTLGTLVPTTTEPSAAAASSPSATAGGPGSTTRPPSVSDVVNALQEAADSAARSAARESGYRAGLLGSIAASCTVSYTVALAQPRQTP